jgi:hypothetical protein
MVATWHCKDLELSSLFLRCKGRKCQVTGKKHTPLSGLQNKDKTWWTAGACPYPIKFCDAFATQLVRKTAV